MKKYNWYFLLIACLIASFILQVLFVMFDLTGEIGVYILCIGFMLVMPIFLFSIVILSLIKGLSDKILTKKNKNNTKIVFGIMIITLLVISPFFDVLQFLKNFYAEDTDHILLVYPWFFIILLWLFLFHMLTRLLHMKSPNFWIRALSPSITVVAIFCIISPFLILGRVNFANNGHLCFLADEENKKECIVTKFVNNLGTINGCSNNDLKELKKENCVYRFAVKNKDMSVCNFLTDEPVDKGFYSWNYSSKKMCFYAIAYLSGDITACNLINNDDIVECKDTFRKWSKNEAERIEENKKSNIIQYFIKTIR